VVCRIALSERHTLGVKSDSELVAAAHLSYIGSFGKLVEHIPNGEVRSLSPVFTFVTGLPIPLFNGCVVVESTTEVELDSALVWLNRRRVPYLVSIAEPLAPQLSDVVTVHGLQGPAPYPAMVLHPVPESPDPAPGVTVVAGTEPGLLDYLPPTFAADTDVRVFTARLGGVPVGNSIAIRTGEVAGVYGVGTRPEARRRGIGTAISWAAVGAGRAWGCDPIVLQATEMGLPIYERMGFRTVVRYITFRSGGG
jgi:GNAT superfamily N-acetyltransferase